MNICKMTYDAFIFSLGQPHSKPPTVYVWFFCVGLICLSINLSVFICFILSIEPTLLYMLSMLSTTILHCYSRHKKPQFLRGFSYEELRINLYFKNKVFLCHQTACNLLYSPGWPQTQGPPASTQCVLGLQACTAMPTRNIFVLLLREYFMDN
jgi:hypothetical protein